MQWKLIEKEVAGINNYTSRQEAEDFLKVILNDKRLVGTTSRATLNMLLQFETKKNKYFYDFTKEDIIEMYTEQKSISARSLQNKNLLLKEFNDYICETRDLDKSNIYAYITKEDILKCVDIEKRELSILSRENLSSLQEELFNQTDKGLLEALFLGLGGYKLKELSFFNVNNIKKGSMIFINNKYFTISQEQGCLLTEACCETSLISFGVTMRESICISHGLFKERFNALSSSANLNNKDDLERRYRFFQRRLMLMSDYLGVNLTSGKVQESGFLHFLKFDIEESGLNFEEYIKTKKAKKLANRFDIYTDLYPQVLKEKFGRYFD